MPRGGKIIDLSGQRFGRLTAETFYRGPHQKITWRCLCDCGARTTAPGYILKAGKTKSCGCLRKDLQTKHGATKNGKATPEYSVWTDMKARVLNPNSKSYPSYGGRGIRIDPTWVDDFGQFLIDVGPRPSTKHQLDRYPDNDGNYEPGNVRWATVQENMNNRIRITADNALVTLTRAMKMVDRPTIERLLAGGHHA